MIGFSLFAEGWGFAIPKGYLYAAIAFSVMIELLNQIASRNRQKQALAGDYAFQTQVTQTALANGHSKIDERLCRWLLMADDRVDADELPLTHEFLSLMLGTQRSVVTLAVRALERDGLIATRRGRITIRNRAGLEKKSNGTYTRQR